ncbi:Aste57867_20045 [Aphanomyces stellatus]|uniref:Aste57867_20045 protein n=1 Tax=Aphanomyces stellatus TaxID=120398 RepID=A0A485LEN2_9STRA|nr:hypothetical protein As57867_019979 [Aphanomyces stellatus]VFT96741.1 Aste57867_20045 [Aphanomyces stellatus]
MSKRHREGEGDVKKRARKAAHAENQRAHVRRRQAHTETLEADVDALQVETARLEGQIAVLQLHPTTLNTKRTEKLLHEYVRLFEYGYLQSHASQVPFIRAVMREDVVSHGFVGVNNFLETFRRYCSVDTSFEMRFLNCVCVEPEDAAVSCILHVMVSQRITRGLLALYFPDVLHNEPLVQRLIGARLDIRTTSIFVFDSSGRISENSGTMELVSAFVKLVQNLELACMIVEGNRLHPKHYIRA